MSGVEAAGLVLASIPLVISALDHYAKGVETIARWWRYKAELLALSNTLCAENNRLIFTCERLLRDLVPEDMLDVFMADSSLWKDAFLEGKLCERLKSPHSIFLKLIGDTNEALKELQSRLKLDGEWKPVDTAAVAFKEEFRAIKFSLSRRRIREMSARIQRNNDLLSNLTAQNIELEPLRARNSQNSARYLKAVQKHAKVLHSLINQGWACQCRDRHRAHLRLDARLPDKTTESGADAADPSLVRFAVVFSTDHHSPDQTLWSWQETEIRLIERPKDDASQVSPPIDSAHLVDQMIMEPPWSSSLPKRSLLASSIFKKPTAPSKRQKISKGLTLDNSLQPSGNDTKTIACLGPDISHQHHIKDLCLTFRNLVKERAQGDQSIGYFTCGNEPEALQLYSPHASEEQGPRQQPTVSLLADSLSKSNNICIANPSQGCLHLNRAHRLELALTISSSILQLHDTPWLLSERLTKQDIQLHTHSLKSIHESNPQRNHQRQHAFVSSTFGSRSIGGTTALPFPGIPRNPTLFALSILLIELCLGHPFESLRNPTLDPLDANGKPNILTDISAADRLLEDVYREAGNRYGDAVNAFDG